MKSVAKLSLYYFSSRYQVFKTEPLSQQQVRVLDKLPFDFWKGPHVGKAAQVMVPPKATAKFRKILEAHGIEYTVPIEDVEQLSLHMIYVLTQACERS